MAHIKQILQRKRFKKSYFYINLVNEIKSFFLFFTHHNVFFLMILSFRSCNVVFPAFYFLASISILKIKVTCF